MITINGYIIRKEKKDLIHTSYINYYEKLKLLLIIITFLNYNFNIIGNSVTNLKY